MKYQNSRPTYFSVINDRAIYIIVRQVRSDNPFKDLALAGSAIIFEPFESIQLEVISTNQFLVEVRVKLVG